MMIRTIHVFGKKEEEALSLLTLSGLHRPAATVLVFLANIPEATSRDVERSTDLRQSEVSIAMKYLGERGWITDRMVPSDLKGRPVRAFSLAVPFESVLESITQEMKDEAERKIALVRKMREMMG
jgi:predicted transcriptional regulator